MSPVPNRAPSASRFRTPLIAALSVAAFWIQAPPSLLLLPVLLPLLLTSPSLPTVCIWTTLRAFRLLRAVPTTPGTACCSTAV